MCCMWHLSTLWESGGDGASWHSSVLCAGLLARVHAGWVVWKMMGTAPTHSGLWSARCVLCTCVVDRMGPVGTSILLGHVVYIRTDVVVVVG
jgi:hypothetical protein